MMDATPLYPDGFHPTAQDHVLNLSRRSAPRSRSAAGPIKYYLIDLGLAGRWERGQKCADPAWGADKSVPEFIKDLDAPYDPFPTDVYYFGNLIRTEFLVRRPLCLTHCSRLLQPRRDFAFLKPLVDKMTADAPEARPTMTEALAELRSIRDGLSRSTLGRHISSPIYRMYQSLSRMISRYGPPIKSNLPEEFR